MAVIVVKPEPESDELEPLFQLGCVPLPPCPTVAVYVVEAVGVNFPLASSNPPRTPLLRRRRHYRYLLNRHLRLLKILYQGQFSLTYQLCELVTNL